MPAQPPRDLNGYQIQNDNRLLFEYPGALGGKTGFTDIARHTYVGAAERNGRRLVVSVLGAEIRPVRAWQQGAGLLDWGFSLPRGAQVGHLVVPGEADKLVAPPEPTPEPAADAGRGAAARRRPRSRCRTWCWRPWARARSSSPVPGWWRCSWPPAPDGVPEVAGRKPGPGDGHRRGRFQPGRGGPRSGRAGPRRARSGRRGAGVTRAGRGN